MRGFLSSLFVVGKDTAKSLVKKTVIESANLVDNIKDKASELDEKRNADIRMKIDAIHEEYIIISRVESVKLHILVESNDMKGLAEFLKYREKRKK